MGGDSMETLKDALSKRILILDGGMGTMIQRYGLTEEDYRGKRFAGHGRALAGDNDVLVLTRPDVIAAIHRKYLEAGADIIGTCTFGANAISQAEYGLSEAVEAMNAEAVRIAREAADAVGSRQGRSCWVAGSVGPTNVSLSMAADVDDPSRRTVDFEAMFQAYRTQMAALLSAGVDVVLVETIFDALNAKAANLALIEARRQTGRSVPIMFSATLADAQGRLLSGQTLEAFLASVQRLEPLSLGLNCGFGVAAMEKFLPRLSRHARCATSCYPNAGLPNADGSYNDDARMMADKLAEYAEQGWLNIVGGCCGTTPQHIAAIAQRLKGLPPRVYAARGSSLPRTPCDTTYRFGVEIDCLRIQCIAPCDCFGGESDSVPVLSHPPAMRSIAGGLGELVPPAGVGSAHEKPGKFIERNTVFSGLECLTASDVRLVVAERANVTGSKKFKRLIAAKLWDEALDVARDQMRAGAHLIDVCMDDAMLDAPILMRDFLRRIAAEPEIAYYPLVIDSSDFEVIRAALREVPGRCLINSISLKHGEADFLDKAREIQAFGAAVVVMAFDEQGQASTASRRIDILSRAVDLLKAKLGFDNTDIVLDPNILAIGTGLEEHDNQALSFLEACRALRHRYPGIQTIGGLSNLSFSFRGRDDVREAIHAAFLSRAGHDLSMVIANPALSQSPDAIDPTLYALASDLVAAKPEALDACLAWMQNNSPRQQSQNPGAHELDSLTPAERLKLALLQGTTRYLKHDMQALAQHMSPLAIIEGPLMEAMNVVGDAFGRGDMYLPQIVKAARIMKQAIGYLTLDSAGTYGTRRKRALIATVWGDVHDIGKNIVSIVLTCHGYEVIDLGVMVETSRIVDEAKAHNADAIGLSGLISPSLNVMVEVAKALREAGIRVPLFVGGAATSDTHAAIKIAPAYAPGIVAHIADASRVPGVIGPWLAPETSQATIDKIQSHHDTIRKQWEKKSPAPCIPIDSARQQRSSMPTFDDNHLLHTPTQRQKIIYRPADLAHRLSWTALAHHIRASQPTDSQTQKAQNETIIRDAQAVLEAAQTLNRLNTHCAYRFVAAQAQCDDIVLYPDEAAHANIFLHGFRNQTQGMPHLAIADFLPADRRSRICLFAMACPSDPQDAHAIARYTSIDKDYVDILAPTLATALVAAACDALHHDIMSPLGKHIRPAPGYPICPDHRLKATILDLLDDPQLGITLTPSYMMQPLAAICGFTAFHPDIHLFDLGKIDDDQRQDYAKRTQTTPRVLAKLCGWDQ